MILVADSGTTKTSWCLIEKNSDHIHFSTEGFNPYYVGSEYITNSILSNLPAGIECEKITEIYFYGAGCSADKIPIVEKALKDVFLNLTTVAVESDLLAAARSVLGHNKGFVAILGTGTNSCLYNGDKITYQVDSLGFILGDEGSGAYLGKKILIAYTRDFLPADLKKLFREKFKLSDADIINNIYTKPLPNRFSAGFSKFVGENISHPFIVNLVKNAFRDFFNNIVAYYPDYSNYSLNCVGSVAFNFLPQLQDVAKEFNMPIGNIIRNPIEGLLKYHDN